MVQEFLQRTLLLVPPVLLALTVHECAHAWVANRLGDPTAKMLGRVTFNPIKHLDPIGTLMLFFSGLFGWAKPVPINPRNFSNISRDIIMVSVAGPLSNLFLAALSALVYKALIITGPSLLGAMPNVVWPLFTMLELSIRINVALAVFNMIPIPPLDGSKVLGNLLPANQAFAWAKFEQYGFFVLLLLIVTGALHKFISPVIFVMVGLLMGGIY